MVRKLVVCCALAGALGLAVGCEFGAKPAVAARDEAAADYKKKLDDVDKKVGELKAKADKATGDEKVKLDAKLKGVAAKREAFVKKHEELKQAAADKWEGMKAGVGTAFDELKKAAE